MIFCKFYLGFLVDLRGMRLVATYVILRLCASALKSVPGTHSIVFSYETSTFILHGAILESRGHYLD